MNIFTPLNKSVRVISTFGSAVVDTIEGTINLGSKAKSTIEREVSSWQEERDMENAVSRIKLRAEKIRELQEALGITVQEASDLLREEMKK